MDWPPENVPFDFADTASESRWIGQHVSTRQRMPCLSQQRELAEAGAFADARQLRAVALVVDGEAAVLDHVEHVSCSATMCVPDSR